MCLAARRRGSPMPGPSRGRARRHERSAPPRTRPPTGPDRPSRWGLRAGFPRPGVRARTPCRNPDRRRVAVHRAAPIGSRPHGPGGDEHGGLRGLPEVAAERRAPRRTAAQMIIVGVIASVLGIIAGLPIDWFPRGRRRRRTRSTRLGRPDHRVRPDLRPRDDRHPVLGPELRCGPGEEELDGPPIHGNTRIEVIWTALPRDRSSPASCAYAYVVLRDIEKSPAKRRPRSGSSSVFGQQFAWTFQYNEGGRRSRPPQLYLPEGRVREVRRPVQGRHPRLLGPGLADEDRRGPRDHDALPRHARSRRSAPTRSSAPSSAGSGTPSCARPRTW